MIRKLFAFGLAVVLALMPVQAFGKTVSVTNVSYDPTREMFEHIWNCSNRSPIDQFR